MRHYLSIVVTIFFMTLATDAHSMYIRICDTCETLNDFKTFLYHDVSQTDQYGSYLVINSTTHKAAELRADFILEYEPPDWYEYLYIVSITASTELEETFDEVTLSKAKVPPLTLPLDHNEYADRIYNIAHSGHEDIINMLRIWIDRHVTTIQSLQLQGKLVVTVVFSDGYSAQYLYVVATSSECCTFIPGSVRDPDGNPVQDNGQPLANAEPPEIQQDPWDPGALPADFTDVRVIGLLGRSWRVTITGGGGPPVVRVRIAN